LENQEYKTENEKAIVEYNIVKHNDLIQRSRHYLSTQEQKIILYLISHIKPDDSFLKLYEFKIIEFCEICGIDETSGRNYSSLKNTIKKLADKSFWITLDNGNETIIRWIERPYIDPINNVIKIKLDELMKPYLLELKNHFTVYNLYFTLAMKSKYSLRIYELLKSYQNMGQCEFEIEQLKKILFAEKYHRYQDFRVKVIELAIKEINEYSDLIVTYKLQKEGRKFNKIYFYMTLKKDTEERIKVFKKIQGRKKINKKNSEQSELI